MKHSPGFVAIVDDARKRIRECGVADVKARNREEGRLSFLGQFLRGSLLRDIYITRSWD